MLDTASSFMRAVHVSKQVQSGETPISILRDVNLTIKLGESIAILGASGSGKTTLLTLLAGLDIPTAGEIYYRNQQLSSLKEEERTLLRGREMGFIFQNFQLLPTLTALENVMLPLEIQYVRAQEAETSAREWLSRVGLGKRLHHYPSQLSGGEAQRVAIARAFVKSPNLLLADEMTGNLDVATAKTVTDILFSLNKTEQTTLLLVTHDAKLADQCERRLLLEAGELRTC